MNIKTDLDVKNELNVIFIISCGYSTIAKCILFEQKITRYLRNKTT